MNSAFVPFDDCDCRICANLKIASRNLYNKQGMFNVRQYSLFEGVQLNFSAGIPVRGDEGGKLSPLTITSGLLSNGCSNHD